MINKQIIGLGGGGFTMEPQNPLLDLYILKASKHKQPRVCLLPTASADNSYLINHFEKVFDQYPCTTTHLDVFSPPANAPDMADVLLNSNIIYVPGGNTKSMLALWREWGVDKILKQAYDKGILLAGVSAGFVCWFEECITDSLSNKFSVLPCMGFLPGSSCPHYDGQPGRQEAYHQLLGKERISPGYAVEDGVGLHFVNGKLLKAIASRPNVYAYYLSNHENDTREEKIEPDFLGTDERVADLCSIFDDN